MRTPLPPQMTCGFLIQLVFCKEEVEVEQETSAPPPKKNPGPAPDIDVPRVLFSISQGRIVRPK